MDHDSGKDKRTEVVCSLDEHKQRYKPVLEKVKIYSYENLFVVLIEFCF